MFENSRYFEPTRHKTGFLYCFADVRPHLISVEGRSKVAVTHLAVARRQNTGTGILGVLEEKRAACSEPPLCFYRDF